MSEFRERIVDLSFSKRVLLARKLGMLTHGDRVQIENVDRSEFQKESGRRTVAYVVFDGNKSNASAELREYITGKLPDYMVPSSIVVLDTLPLLPNGKVDRKKLPYPSKLWPFDDRDFMAPRSEVERILADIWSDVLGLEKVGIHDHFIEIGGDSILAIRVVAKIRSANLRVTPMQLFEFPTIAELANVVVAATQENADQGSNLGPTSLAPIQKWFFEQNFTIPEHWNQALLLDVTCELDFEIFESSVKTILFHHDALRTRFVRTGTRWEQSSQDADETATVIRVDLSHLSAPTQEKQIQRTAEDLHCNFDLENGNLIRLAYFDYGNGESNRLLIVAHHLVIDNISWGIFLEDLEAVYVQLAIGKKIDLPNKTTSYNLWSKKLLDYTDTVDLNKDRNFWLQMLQSGVTKVPTDFSSLNNTEEFAQHLRVSLSAPDTECLLQQVPAVYNTEINDILLTALVRSYCRRTASSRMLIGVEGHGREEFIAEGLDLSRTIGWFTSYYPVLLKNEQSENIGDSLKSTKEQLRRIPTGGITYGLIRYLQSRSEEQEIFNTMPQPEILFNYLGQIDRYFPDSRLFWIADNPVPGPVRSKRNCRTHLIEINAVTAENKLSVDWTFSTKCYRLSTIEEIAHEFISELRSIISHCQTLRFGGYTPSDFPESGLDQADLDKFIDSLN